MTVDPTGGNDSKLTDVLAMLVPVAPLALALLAGEKGYAGIKRDLLAQAKRDPVDALLALVLGGGVAFYLAERDANPTCRSPWDGIMYMASVGYDHIFPDGLQPTTPTGHALALFAQRFAPALAGAALAAETAESESMEARQQVAVLERLDRIIELLDKR